MASNPSRDARRLPMCLAAVGVLFSVWLWVIHVRTYVAPRSDSVCSINDTFDCTRVAASKTSVLLGLPLAAWGVVAFGALLFLIWRRSKLALPIAGVMALGAVVLTLIQIFQIGSLCFVCEGAHAASLAVAFFVFKDRAEYTADWKDETTLKYGVLLPASVLLSLFMFLPRYWGAFSYKAPPPFPTGKTEEGFPWIGAENPSLTIHEFTDYRCPHCAYGSARSLRKLAQRSDVRIVRRQHPRLYCTVPAACEAVRVAYCAEAQGKFWQADRYLFENLEPRKSLDLPKIARDLKLDEGELERCFHDPKTQERANAEAQAAFKYKIIDTPGYMIDGKRIKLEELEEIF